MVIYFDGFVALVLAFLMLRKSSTIKRHVLAFLVAGLVSGIVAFAAFGIFNPYPGYTDAARFNASMDSLFAWVLGCVAGFVLGAAVAKLLRRKAQPTLA